MNRKIGSLTLVVSLLAGCATAPAPVDQRNSILTQGNVQMNLKVGVTNKANVLNAFGSPNITTRDASGEEVWSYQRQASVTQSSGASNYWSIFLTGESRSAEGLSQSSRMMTLIITFDKNDIVNDFRSRSSDF